MATATKPLRRDTNLVPLSREHHFGLLFCWKLKQGLAKNVELAVMQQYVCYFWNRNLKEHFDQEEKLLLTILPPSDLLQIRLLEEHKKIRLLVDEIATAEPATNEQVDELQQLLNDHIRFEERQFFPHLEKQATPSQLALIGELLQEDEHQPADEFEPAFWLIARS